MSKLLELADIVKLANEFFDTKPEFSKSPHYDVEIDVPEEPDLFYDNKISVFACNRFARFKFRDSEIMVEYQLDMMPWKPGYSLQYWYDGHDRNQRPWQAESPRSASTFAETEEEYFQLCTIHEGNLIDFELLLDVKKLQDRIFEYFGIEVDTSNKLNVS